MSIKPITLHTDTPLAKGVVTLLHELETRLELSKPLGVFVAGGVAAHLYTAARSTYDVDAEFSSRILIPQDLAVDVDMGEEGVQTLFFDTNFNSTFALMYEDYLKDSVPLDAGLEFIKVHLLSPVDLAVPMLWRLKSAPTKLLVGASAICKKCVKTLIAPLASPSRLSLRFTRPQKRIWISGFKFRPA
jgi:hypothetical protein